MFGMIQSGINHSAISYTDKIPFAIYGEYIKPLIENIKLNDGQVKDLDYKAFESLFYANNSTNKYVRSFAKKLSAPITPLGDWKSKNFDTKNSKPLFNN